MENSERILEYPNPGPVAQFFREWNPGSTTQRLDETAPSRDLVTDNVIRDCVIEPLHDF